MRDRTALALMLAVFLAAWFLPVEQARVQGALIEAFALAHEYARAHVLLCLVPALFIAGAISVFVSQASVLRYLGPAARRWVAYPVASVSGAILAVCSCTVLPLFAGIYGRGAGLGPAAAFLYSGPAINVLAIILTARVLGAEMGVARAAGAVGLSMVIGLLMEALFRGERAKVARVEPATQAAGVSGAAGGRRLWQEGLYLGALVGVLVFANWSRAGEGAPRLWSAIFAAKWVVTGVLLVAVGLVLARWFSRSERMEWVRATWHFARQILPLLLAGVLVAGFLFGRPGHDGLISSRWVAGLVGGNSVAANLFAAVAGALMYFATLTEVPILQGLLGAGMGRGPALALLLAGPALSLPSMLVIRSVLGMRKSLVYFALVIAFSALAGLVYGEL